MRGRSNRTPKKRRLLLETVAGGLSITAAARRAGVSRRAVYDWRDADPQFARELEDAFEEGTDRISDEVFRLGRQPGNLAGLIFLLKQRDPRRFNQKMVELHVSGDPNNPVTVDHQHTLGRGRLLILPSNDRPSLSETEIQQERERIAREHLIEGNALPVAVIEAAEGAGDSTDE
jgi:hypothetical protein